METNANELALAWRVGLRQWETDSAFEALAKLLRQNRGVVDEVALFETITHHLYIPLVEYARRMELAARRMEALRQAGIRSVGINVLCTIGHVNEAWSYMPPLPFQGMVGSDGAVSKGCACPNTPELRTYIRAKYALVAQARPDFIWVDDDIRMHHHGVAWGCFCRTCLALFAIRARRTFAREQLVQAFDSPRRGRLRELWVEQNISSIESLLADVGKTIRKVDSRIAIGFMTCGPGWTTYSGLAFDRWFAVLGASKARPGGGFYSDYVPAEMFGKALECGRQRAILPRSVRDVQYELENFPYQRLKKSATAVIDECSLALAYGMNGIAFNMLGMTPSLEDSLQWVARISAARPAWEQWVAHAGDLPTAGLWPAWSSRLLARRSVRQGERWLDWNPVYNMSMMTVMGEIGLSLAADSPGCGTILCGRVAEAFTNRELERMLAGGILMDAMTAEVFAERGFGRLTGIRIGARLEDGMLERFTADALNGAAADHCRDARIEFWNDRMAFSRVLEPVEPGVRILSLNEDYFGRSHGSAMTAYENTLGGRIVVMGYAPWMFLHSVAKRLQLQNAADWISRDAMPVRIDETVPLMAIARIAADRRRGAVLLLNAGMDAVAVATVRLRITARKARLLAIGAPPRMLALKPDPRGGRLVLRAIEPWGIRMILWG